MKTNKRIKPEEKQIKLVKTQMIDNQSQCPICLEDYDLLRKVPMMICFNQHSTCAKCLSDIYKKRKCPICCEKLINKSDVKKNRLVCYMIEEMYRGNGQIFIYSNSYTYKGEVKNGKRHGMGQQMAKNGNFFKGNFVHGEINGKCEVITKNGARFQGQASNGRLQGVFTTKYGSVIEGNFDMQSLSGPNCTKKYTNGDVYTGMVNNLRADGFGKLTFNNGNTFEGQFERDYIRGDGSATIVGTFQLQINHGEAYIKQIGEQIRVDPIESSQNQSEQSSLSSFSNRSISNYDHYS